MYARRPEGDRYGGIRLPSNYSGNAFRRDIETRTEESPETLPTETVDAAEIESEEARSTDEKDDTLPVSAFRLPKADRRGGIGFEELLLIGLIFLISQNDGKDDLSYLLLLLLFLG